MRKNFFTTILLCVFTFSTNAQLPADTSEALNDTAIVTSIKSGKENKKLHQNSNSGCVFNIKPKIDIPVTALGIAGTLTGFALIAKKPNTDLSEINELGPEDLAFGWDKDAVHNYDPIAGDMSDYIFYGGFAYGLILLVDHDIRQDALKIGLLYLQTMSITGTSYAMTAGLVSKFRPYAYNVDTLPDGSPEVPEERKTSHNATNSFYGGHPSVPAASCLFVASVYSAYHPESSLKYVLYGVAAAATGATAYLRYKGGYHFPTDLAVGVALGTTYGLVIPRLHRCKGLTVTPVTGSVQGLNINYTF